jgi:hypothetical protein
MTPTLPQDDDDRIIERTTHGATTGRGSVFAVTGPTQTITGELFATRTEAEFRGTALARQAGVSVWFRYRGASLDRELSPCQMTV